MTLIERRSEAQVRETEGEKKREEKEETTTTTRLSLRNLFIFGSLRVSTLISTASSSVFRHQE